MLIRLVVGLLLTLAALAIAGRRVHFLFRVIRTGQQAPGRLDRIDKRAWSELSEVFGQRKLLTWTVPGLAHFFTFWGFVVLGATILEAYGAIFNRDFFIPLTGKMTWLGFLEDFFGSAVLVALATFLAIRVHLHGVRSLPESVPGLEHQQAAVAQAADHGLA